MIKHNLSIEKKREIERLLKSDKSLDRTFLIELLDYPNEVVRIQSAYVLIFELYLKRDLAIKTLKQIVNESTNSFNVMHCNLMLKKLEGFFYSKLLVIMTYITILSIIYIGFYYNVILKNHEGPMDLWAIIMLICIVSIYLLIILIARIKKISLLDGSDNTNKFALPIIWLAKITKYLRRI